MRLATTRHDRTPRSVNVVDIIRCHLALVLSADTRQEYDTRQADADWPAATAVGPGLFAEPEARASSDRDWLTADRHNCNQKSSIPGVFG